VEHTPCKRILITGFEPFGGQTINPSWEAVQRLPEQIGNYQLEKMLIPVEYGGAAQQVLDAAQLFHPDVIVCIGQAGGRSAVTPEVIGINLRESKIPDNAGILAQGQPILPDGPAAYFSTLPVRDMVRAINNRDMPGALSYSAGAYVCNDVLYTLLHHFRDTPVRIGFIHVPYLPQQGQPNLTLEQIVSALEAALLTL